MRTKQYRLHHEERIKQKYINRVRDDYFRFYDDPPVDWGKLRDHYKKFTETGEYIWRSENEYSESAESYRKVFKLMNGDKPYHKSIKSWKQMHNRRRRAKIRDRMKNEDYDNIPVFRKENDWLWT